MRYTNSLTPSPTVAMIVFTELVHCECIVASLSLSPLAYDAGPSLTNPRGFDSGVGAPVYLLLGMPCHEKYP